MDLQRIGNCLSKLEAFYQQQLTPALQEDFFEFCVDNFQGIAQIEKAVTLLIAKEPNYGHMPNFDRLKEVFSDYLQTKRPEYQGPNQSALALPPAQERGVNPKDWTPLTAEELAGVKWGQKHPVVERLKAKIYVSQFFKSQASWAHGTQFREEAITEAKQRCIPLDLIGGPVEEAA